VAWRKGRHGFRRPSADEQAAPKRRKSVLKPLLCDTKKRNDEITLESSKSARGEHPAASEATKPGSEMAPSGAAKTEAAPPVATKTEPSAKGAEKMAAVPSDAVGVNDYYKQNVYDTSDNTVGEVSDLLLDKSGQVKAVILSVGGFLGLGGKYVSVPFNALQLTEKNGKRYLVVDTTKEALRSAPGYRYDSATGKWVLEKA
jgi:sporulation protein YlmC with PRC-barrel domain